VGGTALPKPAKLAAYLLNRQERPREPMKYDNAGTQMSAEFIYDWGQEVRIAETAPASIRPGKAGSVCGSEFFKYFSRI